jgi:RND family efflux transporter MFP subunit
MKNILKWGSFLLLLIIIGFAFYKKVYIPKHTYEIVTPIQGDLKVQVYGIGNISAKTIYKVNSEVSGRILKLNSDIGKWVKKGELLAVVDSVDLPKKLEIEKLNLEKAKLNIEKLNKDLEILKVKKWLANKTFQRNKKLLKSKGISEDKYDTFKANLEEIIKEIESNRVALQIAQKEIFIASKNIESIKLQLNKFKIYSSSDGLVISRSVSLNQNVMPNEEIFEIVNPKDVWVKSYIDERVSKNLKVGQKADITLNSNSNIHYKGIVARITPVTDLVTEEREVDVAFKKLPIPFYINAQGNVAINVKTYKNIYKIPANVIVYKNKKPGVWVKIGDRAEFKEIKIIDRNDKFVIINDKNLKIIVPDSKKAALKNGSKVL